MKKKISSFEDLEVYQKLCALHLDIHTLTFKFPDYELHETGAVLRKSSNLAAAYIAEYWNNKQTDSYIKGIDRGLGEIQVTMHHLSMALKKQYIDQSNYRDLLDKYDECKMMMKLLKKSLHSKKNRYNTFTKNQYRKPF